MFTFAQNIFHGKRISTETGIRSYTEAGIFLLEQDTGFSADVLYHIFWNYDDRIIFLRCKIWSFNGLFGNGKVCQRRCSGVHGRTSEASFNGKFSELLALDYGNEYIFVPIKSWFLPDLQKNGPW